MQSLLIFSNISISLGWEALGVVITFLVSIVGAAFCFGKTWSSIERLKEDVKSMNDKVDDRISRVNDSMQDIAKSVSKLEGRLMSSITQDISGGLAEAHSPIQLSQQGRKVLQDSKIDAILDPRFDDIVCAVKSKKPENSYQAQEAVFDAVYSLLDEGNDDLKNAIEESAFLSGKTPMQVLFVGALNIRDKVMDAIGMNAADIDNHDPKRQ